MTTTPAESVYEGEAWLLSPPRRAVAEPTVDQMTSNEEAGMSSQPMLHLPGGDQFQERESLYQTIREQASQLDRLSAQVDSLLYRQRELRTMLLEAHEELAQRDAEVEQIRARHQSDLEQRTAEVTAALHGEILRRDAEIAHRDAELERRDAELVRRDAATDELRTWAFGEINELRVQLERDRRQLNSFRTSRLWRSRQLLKRFLRV
jgi:hypothetical protein